MPSPALLVGSTIAGVILASIGFLVAPGAAVGAVLCGSVVAVAITSRQLAPGRSATVREARRTGAVGGVASCAALLVVTGLVVLLGPAGGLVIAVFVVAGVVGWRRLNQPDPDGDPEVGPGVGPRGGESAGHGRGAVARRGPPSTMATPELCAAWRSSCLALVDATTDGSRAELVRWRAALLDELEQRDSAGFRRWLDTGARAGSDPARYLATDR